MQCYQYYSSVLSLDVICRLIITDFYAHTNPGYDICPNANFRGGSFAFFFTGILRLDYTHVWVDGVIREPSPISVLFSKEPEAEFFNKIKSSMHAVT